MNEQLILIGELLSTAPYARHVDHVIGLADNPRLAYDPANLVASCTRCNSKRMRAAQLKRAKPADGPVREGAIRLSR
jgi:5-methylcytosine-specific restriction endonuclease McrA